jgi:hypothetical protein
MSKPRVTVEELKTELRRSRALIASLRAELASVKESAAEAVDVFGSECERLRQLIEDYRKEGGR